MIRLRALLATGSPPGRTYYCSGSHCLTMNVAPTELRASIISENEDTVRRAGRGSREIIRDRQIDVSDVVDLPVVGDLAVESGVIDLPGVCPACARTVWVSPGGTRRCCLWSRTKLTMPALVLRTVTASVLDGVGGMTSVRCSGANVVGFPVWIPQCRSIICSVSRCGRNGGRRCIFRQLEEQELSRARNEPLTDGGLFSTSLLYALESYGLATCPLNMTFDPSQERRTRKLLDFPDNESWSCTSPSATLPTPSPCAILCAR